MLHILLKSSYRAMRCRAPILPYNKFRFDSVVVIPKKILIFFSFLLKPWKPRFREKAFSIKPIKFKSIPIVLLVHHFLHSRHTKMNQLFPTTTYPLTVPFFPWIHQQILMFLNLRFKGINFFLRFPNLPLFDAISHRIQTIGEEGSSVMFSMFLCSFPHSPLLCKREGS